MGHLHEHLEILRCPVTGSALRPARHVELAAVNARSEKGALRTIGGATVNQPIADGVVGSDHVLYPVVDGIYCLLAGDGIELGEAQGVPSSPDASSEIKDRVRSFYDQVGWRQGSAEFTDAELWEDLRPVSEQYRRTGNARVRRHLPKKGRYLLDAASGPIQYQDYAEFSAGYDVRVCVDLSMTALREVKRKLGGRALCVLGDVTNLPIRDGGVDAFVSLHTIYHVPVAEQRTAFLELHRVLADSGRGVVVYLWGANRVKRVAEAPIRLAGRVRDAALRARKRPPAVDPEVAKAVGSLYYAPHSYRWFSEECWPFEAQIVSWRSLSVPMLRRYVPDSRLGQRLLDYVVRFEERFPEACGRFGTYPLIVVEKSQKQPQADPHQPTAPSLA